MEKLAHYTCPDPANKNARLTIEDFFDVHRHIGREVPDSDEELLPDLADDPGTDDESSSADTESNDLPEGVA